MPTDLPETNESGDDLRTSLETAFDAAAEQPAEVSESAAATTEAYPDAGAVAKSDAPADGRARGSDGKFIAKEEAPAKAADPAGQPEKSTSADSPTKASTEQPSTAADAPPVGWTADAKAEWSKLSPAIKAAVVKRETEISNGGRQWSDERRRLDGLVAPIRERAARHGISEAEGIQRLVAAQDMLERDPHTAIAWLAKQYGVNLGTSGPQPAEGSSRMENGDAAAARPGIDLAPVLAPLHQSLTAIQERFAAEDRRQGEITQQLVEQFAVDPAHAHFDAVHAEIMALIPHIKTAEPYAAPADILQKAYDQAVWANGGTRQALLDKQIADASAARRATNAAEVGKARLAASSVRGAANGASPPVIHDSIREELEAAFGS